MSRRRPTSQELCADPELAALAALDVVCELASSSLLAQHPDLDDSSHPLTTLAVSIIESAATMRLLLRRYRAALARHYRDMPF